MKEIAHLSEVLGSHKNRRAADVVRMLMLTGARRGRAGARC
jgi:hypothetical protein